MPKPGLRKNTDELMASELECLRLAKLSNEEIAARLHLSVKTVERYLSSVYEKLGAKNRTDAVLIALGKGILKPEDVWGNK